MKIILFYVPFGSEENARAAAVSAIEKQLAACINIFPIQSAYPWQGQLQNDKEFVLILKTMPEKIQMLTAHIMEEHSYEIPAILHWEVEVNETYGDWMKDQMKIEK